MRVALVLGVAVCVAVAVLSGRGDESHSQPGEDAEESSEQPRGAAASGESGAPNAVKSAPAPPLRMRAEGGAPAASDSDPNAVVFADEFHDPPWAEEKEAQVREVLDGLKQSLGPSVGGAEVRGVDCKSTQCAIAIGGSDRAAVVRLVDAIGDERGFYGIAQGINLTRRGDDVVVYVRFRR